MAIRFLRNAIFLSLAAVPFVCPGSARGGSVVKVARAADGSFQLVCGGQPFTVNGVGRTNSSSSAATRCGPGASNRSTRSWTASRSSSAPGATSTATIAATDPEHDPLAVSWEVVAESTDTHVGGDKESVPATFPEAIIAKQDFGVTFRAPQKPGAYRLFVTVRDGKGGASKDNFAFLVK